MISHLSLLRRLIPILIPLLFLASCGKAQKTLPQYLTCPSEAEKLAAVKAERATLSAPASPTLSQQFLYAILNEDLTAMTNLVGQGVNVNTAFTTCPGVNWYDGKLNFGVNIIPCVPLELASRFAMSGQPFQFLIEHGAKLENVVSGTTRYAPDELGGTQVGGIALAEILKLNAVPITVDSNPDRDLIRSVSLRGIFGSLDDTLFSACATEEKLKVLTKNGATFSRLYPDYYGTNLSSGSSPLVIKLAKYDALNRIKALLDAGAEPTALSDKGETLLHASARSNDGHIKTVQFFVDIGIDSKVKNQDGKTAADLFQENLDKDTCARNNPFDSSRHMCDAAYNEVLAYLKPLSK